MVVGCSDFLAGVAARRTRPEAVPALAHATSGLTILIAVWFVSAPAVSGADIAWGAASGAAGAVGFALFLYAMAHGNMSVVAPIAAVTGAVTTVVVGVGTGDRPSGANAVGIAAAVVAIWVITASGGDQPYGPRMPRRILALAAASGVGFGLFFVALSFTSGEAGLWPLVPARVVSVAVLVAINLARHGNVRIDRPAVRPAAVAGVLEAVASVLLIEAVRRGPLSIAGVLGSLYPVSTVLLAFVVLHERLVRAQILGVALAMVAVALTAS